MVLLNFFGKSSRGQIETVGLVVIVVMILVIGIFALSFAVKEKAVNEDILTLKANALRSSLLKTSVCNITIKDEIGNCIYNNPQCFDSCNRLKEVVDEVIMSSLENENYYFKVKGIELGACPEKITSISEVVRGENIEIALCRR